MEFSNDRTERNREIEKLEKSLTESWDIYKKLCYSKTMNTKSQYLECNRIEQCLDNALTVLLNSDFGLHTGSAAEGTDITQQDYGLCLSSSSNCYVSDWDTMNVLYHVMVIDEGNALPQSYGNYIYCLAEQGKHTTAGYRKLRIIHIPKYPIKQHVALMWTITIIMSVDHGYISSNNFVDEILKKGVNIPSKHSVQNDLGTQGPSHLMKKPGIAGDYVRCFYVKTWPQEAESWLTRKTHWPDKKLKIKIKKIGYLLVPTGNSNSKENNLEWRCSFSIAEKLLFESMTKFERYTFIILKVILKEYLPPDVNTDGEKQLLSTYHMKTLFLWSLEKYKIKWVYRDMLGIIGHMLDVLMRWIKKQHFPHYFIPSINLLNRRKLWGKKHSLICAISAIRYELSNKLNQSNFYMGQEVSPFVLFCLTQNGVLFVTYYRVMKFIEGKLPYVICTDIFHKIQCTIGVKFSYILLIDELVKCLKNDRNSQVEHLFTSLYNNSIHDKLLTEVVPGLVNQYLGCIHLAKYCMAAKVGNILPHALHTAESLLKGTLHLDPCSGYVKLACLYIVTHDFVTANDILEAAENNFLYMHKRMKASAIRASQHEGVHIHQITTDFIREVFQKWTEGQVTSDIVVSWPEYNIVPDILQFELIHESTHQVINVPGLLMPGKMVGLNCHLQWSPLSMIRLLKFVSAFNSGQISTSKMEHLVADLIASALSIIGFPGFNDIFTVFNMAAWCYLKIKQYRMAARMMSVTIETCSEANLMKWMWVGIGSSSKIDFIKSCAFCHHFVSYVIAQCLF